MAVGLGLRQVGQERMGEFQMKDWHTSTVCIVTWAGIHKRTSQVCSNACKWEPSKQLHSFGKQLHTTYPQHLVMNDEFSHTRDVHRKRHKISFFWWRGGESLEALECLLWDTPDCVHFSFECFLGKHAPRSPFSQRFSLLWTVSLPAEHRNSVSSIPDRVQLKAHL